MTQKQYRAALKKLGLNLASAAEFLDVSYRTSRRMASFTMKTRVPRSVAMVLRVALRYKLSPERMIERFGG